MASPGVVLEEDDGVSLVFAIKDKYCSAPQPFSNLDDNDAIPTKRVIKVISASKGPGSIPIEEVRTIFLECSRISSIGSVEELVSMCRSVREFHLGGNNIGSWEEVMSIVNSVPNLTYLDLSRNRSLAQAVDNPASFPGISSSPLSALTLSFTEVPFNQIIAALQHLPSITELHLSKNDYTDDKLCLKDEIKVHKGLKMLHLVSNNIRKWESVEIVGKLFPNLETLLMSDNPLDNITPSGMLFKSLKRLNLNDTDVDSWDSLENLLTFPKLKTFSLWHVPVGKDLNENERRFAIISRLPSIEELNKSEISETEREDAERWLIRKYQTENEKRPSVYEDLIEKHGNLQPLPDIDLSPKDEISIEFVFQDIDKNSEIHMVRTSQTTRQLKSWIGSSMLSGMPSSKFVLYYTDFEDGKVYDMHLMKHDDKPLYYYKMKDGDQIEIVLK